MPKNDIDFQIINGDKVCMLQGIQMHSMEKHNIFMRSNNINGQNTSYLNSNKSQCTIGLKGIFIASEEQLLLQHLIFQDQALNICIKNHNFEINALSYVHKYEILNGEDEIQYFTLNLFSNVGNFKYFSKTEIVL